MTKLHLFADDLTGALDTGVFFSVLGARISLDGTPSVGSCRIECLNSRHLSATDAAVRTAQVLESAGNDLVYLKTDSLLRGHVGAALGALASARGTVFFAPAYPAEGRTTVDGIVHVHGTRLTETAAAQDPLNPVKFDEVCAILAAETDKSTLVINPGDPIPADFDGIIICNAASDADLNRAAADALAAEIRNFAGCAGFARALADALGAHNDDEEMQLSTTRLLVVSASAHPATLEQLTTARSLGVPGVWIYDGGHSEELLANAAKKATRFAKSSPCTMLAAAFNDTHCRKNNNFFKSERRTPAEAAAQITADIADCAARVLSRAASTPFVIGGDTLTAFCARMDLVSIAPKFSLAPGVIYCLATDKRGREKGIITKSGGFGDASCILDLADRFN